MCPYSTSRVQLRIEGLTQPPMGPGRHRPSTHQPHEAPHIHRSEALTPVTSQPRCPRAASLTQTNFARNFPRSFFETTQKRCNSNDVNSRFELLAGELRAKLLIDSHDEGASGHRFHHVACYRWGRPPSAARERQLHQRLPRRCQGPSRDQHVLSFNP